VSGAKQIAVTREYRPEPDYCINALELLLKKSLRKEGATRIAALNDDVKESSGYVATKNCNR
jgi:hypothetical protein